MHKISKRLFLWLTLLLALSDGLFVWINYRAEQQELQRQLAEQASDLRHLFDTQLLATAVHMQQTATYIANQPDVQRMFMAGRRAVEAAGSDSVPARAARQALFDHISKPWQRLNTDYDTRQLHFQFGEQAVSFLRVHAPDRYGDPLDDIRYTIIDAIRSGEPTLGFETGRVVSGIRGVVPVRTEDAFIGVLEAGSSFQTLLKTLESSVGARFVVFLKQSHVEGAFWPDRLDAYRARSPAIGDYFIEAMLRSDDLDLLRSEFAVTRLAGLDTGWMRYRDTALGMTAFPLRDYAGGKDPGRPPVGAVLAWFDISPAIAQSEATLRVNLAYAIVGFILIELLLFYALRAATQRLERVVATQTNKLREMAIRDELTGLHTRHYLHEVMGGLRACARRRHEPLSLAMLDLDRFKQINDRYGHLAGDAVLRAAAEIVRKRLRASDLAFRYGGEELLIVFMDTPAEAARQACEDIRALLAASAVAPLPAGAMTASFGISEAGDDLDRTLEQADLALYRAKANGRNRVETYTPAD